MLSATDIRGLYAIIPTPAKPGADRIDATDTVDLAETARVVDRLIKDGVSGLIALGTTGECATLTNSDYDTFVACVLETVGRRVPTFIGSTALGAQEVHRRIKQIERLGGDGTLLGLPMWQPLVLESAVNYYRHVSEAFPNTAIMVYANARAFRFSFPAAFWEHLVKAAPTATSAKFSSAPMLLDNIKASQGRINFVPNENSLASFYGLSPETTIAGWATAAAMGPTPAVALMNAITERNAEGIRTLAAAIAWAAEPVKAVVSNPEVFASYNIQLEKIRINEAGYCRAGPIRPPYDYMPPEYQAAARECGRRWAALCADYQGPYRFKRRLWEQ